MRNYIIYSLETGSILRNIICSKNSIDIQLKTDEAYLQGTLTSSLHYVNLTTKVVQKKTIFNLVINKLIITADGIDNIISTNIPVGTELIFDGERYTINDGIMDITLNVTGIYKVILKYPQYITEEFEIEGI